MTPGLIQKSGIRSGILVARVEILFNNLLVLLFYNSEYEKRRRKESLILCDACRAMKDYGTFMSPSYSLEGKLGRDGCAATKSSLRWLLLVLFLSFSMFFWSF